MFHKIESGVYEFERDGHTWQVIRATDDGELNGKWVITREDQAHFFGNPQRTRKGAIEAFFGKE